MRLLVTGAWSGAAGVLQLYKRMDSFRDSQRKHEWSKRCDLLELFGKVVCIVGCGSVGTECAKRFRAFGCDAIGVDLFPGEDTNYTGTVGLNQLDHVLPDADVLVLTVPLDSSSPFGDMENVIRYAAQVGENNQRRLADVMMGNLQK